MTRAQIKSKTKSLVIFHWVEILKNSDPMTRVKNTKEKEPNPVSSWPIRAKVKPKKNPVIILIEIKTKSSSEDWAFVFTFEPIAATLSLIPTVSS